MSTYSRLIHGSIAALMVVAAGPSYALEFPSTPDRGAPPRGPSLATRGKICLDTNASPSLTSLLPHNAIATTFGVDTDLPLSLWFYIPDTGAATAELIVTDEFGNEIHQDIIELPDTPGTIQVPLPTTTADGNPLTFESGQLYYWDFSLICDATDPSDNVIIGGGIQRIDADTYIRDKLIDLADDPVAQAELYANAGAWQETITLAASLQEQDPDLWTELLSSVGLELAAAQPIVSQISPSAMAVDTTVEPPSNRHDNLQQLLEGIPSQHQE